MAPVRKRQKHGEVSESGDSDEIQPERSYTPSLKKFQSLDKDFETLEERIHEAAKILQLPLNWSASPFSTIGKTPQPNYSQARTEWLLKWLLGELKRPDSQGTGARQDPLAWTFLEWLIWISRDPSALLKSGHLLQTIETALEEGLPSESSNDENPFHRGQGTSSELSEQSTNFPGSAQNSKKRKWSEEYEKQPTPLQKHTYGPISAALNVILTRIENSSGKLRGTVDHRDRLRSVLRTNTVHAAKLLGLCFHHLCALISETSTSTRPDFPYFAPYLAIWDLQALSAKEDTDGRSDAFSSHCLLPAAKLLSTVDRVATSTLDKSIINMLEVLIARETYLPAFRELQIQNTIHYAGSQSPTDARLKKSLDPITDCVSHSLAVLDQQPSVLVVLSSIHILLDIGLRTPPWLPTGSKAGDIWNEALFSALVTCTGLFLSSPPQEPSEPQIRELEDVLEVLATRQARLTQATLENVIRRYAKLSSMDSSVRWSLVAKVIRLDPHVFISNELKVDQEVEGTSAELTELLFHRITDHRREWQFLESDKEPYTLEWEVPPKQELFLPLIEEPQSLLIQKSVVLPLMAAYAQARKLGAFISRWLKQIRRAQGTRVRVLAPQTTDLVWATDVVTAEPRPFVETCMTTGQISELIASQRRETALTVQKVEMLEHSNSSWNSTEDGNQDLASTIVILESVLGAVALDSTIDAAHAVLESLEDDITTIIKHPGIQKDDICARLFRILGRLWTLLRPIGPGSDSLAQAERLQGGSGFTALLQETCESVYYSRHRYFQVITEGFEYIALVISGLLGRDQKPSKTMIRYLEAFLEIALLQEEDDTPALEELSVVIIYSSETKVFRQACLMAFLSSFTRHPLPISCLSDGCRRKVFEETLHRSFEERYCSKSDDPEIHGTSVAPVLRAFIEQVIHTNLITRSQFFEVSLEWRESIPLELASRCTNVDQAASEFFDQFYLSIDPRTIPRHFREKIFDTDRLPTVDIKEDISGADEPPTLGVKEDNIHQLYSKYGSPYIKLSRCVSNANVHVSISNLRRSLKKDLAELSEREKGKLVLHLLGDIQTELSEQTLFILSVGVAILSRETVRELEPPEAVLNGSTPPQRHLSAILPTLCANLCGTTNGSVAYTILIPTHSIIRDKPWLVSQHGVDSVLSSFTLFASSSGPRLESSLACNLYNSLCGITRDLILLHRKHLGGRFHLLLPLLQALLTCLFRATEQTEDNAVSLPPWLDPHTAPLSVDHARAYSRILETLCSPPVSSVMPGKHMSKFPRASLTDEMRAARTYAGQYVPGVIITYCSCQLSGVINPEVREALLPGLFVCVDAVEMNALKAMNASMHPRMRAMWKTLYEERKRHGH